MKATEIVIGVLVFAIASALLFGALARHLVHRRRSRRDDDPVMWI